MSGGALRAIVLHAVGDVGFGGALRALTAPPGAPDPFARLRPILLGADLLFGNLETPLVDGRIAPASPETAPGFGGDPASARWLSSAGFSLVSLANNHVMDYGTEGLRSTIRALEKVGVRWLGAGETLAESRRPVILEARGMKLGCLAYASPGRHSATPRSAGAAPLDEATVLDDLRMLVGMVDAVIVSLHFGRIYSSYPRVEDQALARRLCGAGATAVLGHHPHVLQGIESCSGGVIAYSLGEILFDPRSGYVFNRSTAGIRRESGILRLSISPGVVTGHEFRPAVLDAEGLLPAAAVGEAASSIVERLQRLSTPLAGAGLLGVDLGEAEQSTVAHQIAVLLHHVRKGRFRILLAWLRRLRPRHVRMAVQALLSRGKGK